MARGRFPAVLHCFTGGAGLARTGLELGLYVSFSGILTFKKSEALREVAAAVPLDRLLVETDAPYLAPVPHRGRRNEPAFVRDTAARLAQVRGVPIEELLASTGRNALRLFGPRLNPGEEHSRND
jgi:TatD DNase family protein